MNERLIELAKLAGLRKLEGLMARLPDLGARKVDPKLLVATPSSVEAIVEQATRAGLTRMAVQKLSRVMSSPERDLLARDALYQVAYPTGDEDLPDLRARAARCRHLFRADSPLFPFVAWPEERQPSGAPIWQLLTEAAPPGDALWAAPTTQRAVEFARQLGEPRPTDVAALARIAMRLHHGRLSSIASLCLHFLFDATGDVKLLRQLVEIALDGRVAVPVIIAKATQSRYCAAYATVRASEFVWELAPHTTAETAPQTRALLHTLREGIAEHSLETAVEHLPDLVIAWARLELRAEDDETPLPECLRAVQAITKAYPDWRFADETRVVLTSRVAPHELASAIRSHVKRYGGHQTFWFGLFSATLASDSEVFATIGRALLDELVARPHDLALWESAQFLVRNEARVEWEQAIVDRFFEQMLG